MKTTTIYQKIWLICLTIMFSITLNAQAPPTVQWQNETWLDEGTMENYVPQQSYQEDWWYHHCNAYNVSTGTFLGYITCGYSHLQEAYDETSSAYSSSPYGAGCIVFPYPCNLPNVVSGGNTCGGVNCGEWQPNTYSNNSDHMSAPFNGLPDQGYPRPTFGLINSNGSTGFVNSTNYNGAYNRVIQLNDGNFVSLGYSTATRKQDGTPLYVNPPLTDYFSTATSNRNPFFTNYTNGTNPPYSFLQNASGDANIHHIDIAKFDASGNVLYNYMYCPTNISSTASQTGGLNNTFNTLPNTSLVGCTLSGAALAYQGFGEAFALIQDGTYIVVVGNAWDFQSGRNRAFIMKLNASDLSMATPITFISTQPSIARAIIKDPTTSNYIVSYQVFPSGGNFVNITSIPSNFGSPAWTTSIMATSSAPYINANCWDLIIGTDPTNPTAHKVIAPVITNCDGCSFGGKNIGQLQIYVLDVSTGAINNVPTTLQNVTAFDLKARLCSLNGSTNDFGLVSTIQKTAWINEHPNCSAPSWDSDANSPCNGQDYNAAWWNTNAYVARLHLNVIGGTATIAKVWETNFDSNDPVSCNFPAGFADANYPFAGDNVKRQECVYGITQAPDGGLVISGNSSNNFDDSYLAKLYNDCEANIVYDIQGAALNITSNTHWNSNHKVLGEVVINAGATLTIDNNAIIEFADSKLTGIPTGITVNQGAHLIINNAKLTSIQSCPNAMWDGIVVIGNPTTVQNTSQGIVFIGNTTHTGTISNARIGLLLGYNGSGHYSPPRGGGSFAKCTGATFLNNNIDVQIVPYLSPSNPNANQTSFYQCNFTSNQVLNDPSYVGVLGTRLTTSQHVVLNGVKGVNFGNCTFLTDLTGSLGNNYVSDYRSYGIYSTDAVFSVNTSTTFENLRYGVYTTATNPLNTFNIDHSIFQDCYASIYQSNINSSNVIFNTFKNTVVLPPLALTKGCIFNHSSPSCLSYFYYLNQCNGYIHQENQYSVTSSQNMLGTIFNASTGISNLSYRNTYIGLTNGHQAQAGNSSLSIQCNTNSGVKAADIAITSQGINSIQGSNSSSSGNIFTELSPDGDIKVNLTGTNALTYYYFNNGNQVPSFVTTSKVSTFATLNSNGCLTNYPTVINPCAGQPAGACRIAQVDSLDALIKSISRPLILGDKQDLINKIDSGKPKGVESALLNKSPYLSDAVLLTFLRHSPQFPLTIISNVINANSPISAIVLAVIDSLNLPITINTSGTSVRTQLENQVEQLIDQKETDLNYAMSALLLSGDANSNNKITKLLTKDSTVNSKLLLVYHNIIIGNTTQAQSLIDSLKVLPGLVNITKMQQHSLDLTQGTSNWNSAMQNSITLKQNIMSIAADSTQIGYAAAGAALTMAYNIPSYEVIEVLGNTGSSSRIAQQPSQTDNAAKINSFENKLSAFPNPTNGLLTVNYSIIDPTCTTATLQLIELGSGRILVSKSISCSSTQTQIDLNELSNGVYSLSIQSNLNAPKNIRVIKVQ